MYSSMWIRFCSSSSSDLLLSWLWLSLVSLDSIFFLPLSFWFLSYLCFQSFKYLDDVLNPSFVNFIGVDCELSSFFLTCFLIGSWKFIGKYPSYFLMELQSMVSLNTLPLLLPRKNDVLIFFFYSLFSFCTFRDCSSYFRG